MILVAEELASTTDARWCLDQYAANLERLFPEGFDQSRGNKLEPSDVLPPHGYFVIARLEGRPVGCGALKRLDRRTGEIKRVWTAEAVRGQGVATKIMAALEEIAQTQGFERLRLDTNRALAAAQAMYRKLGYREIPAYNDNPYAHHWYEKRI
ncbi:GNAT family N-acetyltransferase [Mesorhizobium sp. PUT5]|uniref:GNAT family N-acetyltransferase n=1 Tax=Mesorhizobium sp. PUT5 TaxID=3454629 RepID=UPI003FA4A26C